MHGKEQFGMEDCKKVIVAGAGAAGLMAAISAARHGAQVTVLEAMERPGKKLLLTGNGRCNLTNLEPDLANAYYGSGADMAKEVIQGFGPEELLKFFREIGLLVQEKNGYVYPYSAQSGSVLEVLLAEARRLKIKLKYSEKIQKLTKEDTQWAVKTETWCYYADAVILACGSKAVPVTGSDGSGYDLARTLGHSIQTVAPALVPVICKSRFLSQLAGVRCKAEVSLWEEKYASAAVAKNVQAEKGMRLVKKETGELQWTKFGVSGIVVFQLSRFISLAGKNMKQYLKIDLLPDMEKQGLQQLLEKRAGMLGGEKAGMLLAGMLNEKLIPVILECADQKVKARKSLAKTICQNVTQEQIKAVIEEMKQFTLEVTGTKEFDIAQVCAGGVDCKELVPETLESRKQKGLYFAGELLDVDGPCGGYNLQWAWSSGYLAGKSAAVWQK